MTPSPNDLKQIDAALRLVDREVWVITSAHEGRRGGLLATWVSSASIDPIRPVLLIGIAPNHFTAELVQGSKAFAAHLLRPGQIDLAWNFANGSGRSRDKLTGLSTAQGEHHAPVLTDCLASFACDVFAKYDAGDRLFFWGDVVACHQGQAADGSGSEQSLREQAFIHGLTAAQRQALAADRDADDRHNRPLHERWRATNP